MSTRNPTKRDAAQRQPSYTRDEFTAWLAASCERQGVPLIITDPAVLAHVATLLGHHRDRRPRRRAQVGRDQDRSDAPDRLDPTNIQGAGAAMTA